MISLGSAIWGSNSPSISASFAYEKQRSGADMKYRVQVTIGSVTGSHYFGYPIYLQLSIGGELKETRTLKEASPNRWSSAITYTSPWYTVTNKTTGTTPVSFKVYSGLGSSRSGTYSYNMAVDPAATNLSASNGTLGTPLTLNLTRYNTSFTDTITYKCGSITGTVKSGSTATSVVWNTDNGNVVALAAQNTSGPTVDVTFTVTTYSGGTPVGTSSTTVKMTVSDTVKPSVKLSVEDAAGYYAIYGAYVQGYSKLKISVTPTLAYGSPIKTYSITAGGSSYATNSVTVALPNKGSLEVTAKVTDNRGHSSDPVSQTITVLEYAKPVANLSAYRCDSNGKIDPEGDHMRIGLISTISSLGGKNSATVKIEYPGGTLTGSGTAFLSNPLPCDVSTTHQIDAIVTDKLSYTPVTAVIPIAYTLMDYYKTGRGIAFGKVGTREGFDCAMPSYFCGNRLQEVGSPVEASDAVPLGFLVDYIVEQGKSGMWTYCKWKSGRAECWGRRGVDVNVDAAWGETGLYYGTVSVLNFPFSFVGIPALNVNVEYGTDNYSLFVASCDATAETYAGRIMLCRSDQRIVNCVLVYHAFGRWK